MIINEKAMYGSYETAYKTAYETAMSWSMVWSPIMPHKPRFSWNFWVRAHSLAFRNALLSIIETNFKISRPIQCLTQLKVVRTNWVAPIAQRLKTIGYYKSNSTCPQLVKSFIFFVLGFSFPMNWLNIWYVTDAITS